MMNRSIISLAIVMLVLGMISTVGAYLVKEEVAKAMFYCLAVIGQGIGIFVVYLDHRDTTMWKRES